MKQDAMLYREALQVNPVERFNREQIEAIHTSSMILLRDTGITCASEQTVSEFQRAGCSVSEEHEGKRKQWRIKFPEAVLNKALSTVPEQVTLGARDPANTLYLDARKPAVYFGTGSETNKYLRSSLDRFVSTSDSSREMEYPVFQEEHGSIAALGESAHLIDQLEHVDFFIRNVNVQDPQIQSSNKDVHVFFTSLLNTAKHVQGGLTDLEALPSVLQMARIASGKSSTEHMSTNNEPEDEESPLPISFIVCPMKSPLQMVADSSEKVIAIARQNVPLVISSSPQGGSTAPIQEEGMIVQINAEILAGIALAQFANPGTPVIYGSVPVRARLDTLHDCYGAPEFIHYAMGCVQMARYYGIPCYSSAGVADAQRPGIEAVMEKVYSYMGTASSGAHYIHYAFGLLGGTNTFSPLQAVLDNAAVGLVKDILRVPACDTERIETARKEIERTAASSNIFARGIRKQLRNNRVSRTYEFISEGTAADQTFSLAQRKLDFYLAQQANSMPEETIREIYRNISGLSEIEPYSKQGGSV
ncbi:MAG: trimethylamine methyltransferase family protein [Spirochaetota bacterium]